MPLEHSKGLKYAPFIKFAIDEFNISAKAVAALPIAQIISELSMGKYVLASVHPSIRDITSPRPKVKGGHLILILGYDLNKQQLYLHNPSGDTAKNQEYVTVAFDDFEKFFGHRGVVIT